MQLHLGHSVAVWNGDCGDVQVQRPRAMPQMARGGLESLEHFGIETPSPIAAKVRGVGREAMKHDPTMHGHVRPGADSIVDNMHLDALLAEPG